MHRDQVVRRKRALRGHEWFTGESEHGILDGGDEQAVRIYGNHKIIRHSAFALPEAGLENVGDRRVPAKLGDPACTPELVGP